jgi:hypothetical protein
MIFGILGFGIIAILSMYGLYAVIKSVKEDLGE